MRRNDVDRIVLALVEEGQDNPSKYGFGLGDVIRFTPTQVGTILSDLDIEPELIRCRDCRWWDKLYEGDVGYCHAAKYAHVSRNWEISIRRTYQGDFYCADAERRTDEDD